MVIHIVRFRSALPDPRIAELFKAEVVPRVVEVEVAVPRSMPAWW
jgi:hypothetical protein